MWRRLEKKAAESSGALDPGRSLPAERLFRAGRSSELAKLAPSFPEVRFWQAGGLARQGKRGEAITALRDLRRQHPGFQPARVALARLQLLIALGRAEQEDWAGAASALAEAKATGGGLGPASVAAALIFLQAGRRSEAMDAIEEARRCDPADGRLAHALFLVCYHTARGVGAHGLEVGIWERAIASWAALLRDERFWDGWRKRAWQRYKTEPPRATIAELRRQIEQSVSEFLDDGLAQTSEPRRLRVFLRRELRGAELLQSRGGFPLHGQEGPALLCGPLMIRFLKLERAFGDFIASRDARELRICFSSLGGARALLDLERPQEALAALQNLACSRCGEPLASGAQPTPEVPAGCTATCPSFDSLNPGYAGLPGKANALAADALELAVEAHLAVAQLALTASPTDLEAALAGWRGALRLSTRQGREEEVCRKITELALGRVTALEIPARVGEAVALLEAVETVCDGRTDPDLIGRLAELLTVRGIEAANDVASRWEDAVNDLRRAVGYNSYSPHAVCNLGTALRGWASVQEDPAAAVPLLEEAIQVLEEGVRRFPEPKDIAEELRKAREELASIRQLLPWDDR